MKRIIPLVLALLFALSACGGGVPDTVSVDAIESAVDSAIGSADSLVAVDDDYISRTMSLDMSLCDSHLVKINAYGANIDEYGVFKCSDEKTASTMAKAVEDYFALRQERWMPEYMPEEKPKLNDAECKTHGCYVMYAILSSDSASAAYAAFESCIDAG